SFKGVYQSTNSGVAFSTKATTPNILGYPNDGSDAKDQTKYDLSIEADPTTATTVICGSINMWKSTNSGGSFGASSTTQWYDDVVIKDNNTDTMVFVGNANILRTVDGGLTNNEASPFTVGFFPSLARDFNNNRVIFAGDASNIYKSTNFGGSWSTSTTGVGSR